jgi:hypothetical protein
LAQWRLTGRKAQMTFFPYHRDAADGRHSVSCYTFHTMASSPLAPTRTCSPLVPKLPRRPSLPSPCRSPRRCARWPRLASVRATPGSSWTAAATEEHKERKRCLRCGGSYRDEENHPSACAFHGHVTGIILSSCVRPHPVCDGFRLNPIGPLL